MKPITRRTLVTSALAAPALIGLAPAARAGTKLKLAHQGPGGTVDKGDIRDRLSQKFGLELSQRTGGALEVEVYPNDSLVKSRDLFTALRKGALDMAMFPLPAAGGQAPDFNIGLLPAIVSSYDDAYAWKDKPIGKAVIDMMADKGLILVSWLWLGGGVVTKERPVVTPEDAKGLKLRGGSREVDMMLKEAGAPVVSLPSNELYQSLQTGVCSGGVTSASSIHSYRLVEVTKHLTMGQHSFWYILGPMVMSKMVFDRLPKDQQTAILEIGGSLESFGRAGVSQEDSAVLAEYKAAGNTINDMSAAVVGQWRTLAERTAWADYAGRSASAAHLLQLAKDAIA